MDKGDRTLVGWWALLVVLTFLSFESGLTWFQQSGLGAALVILVALVKIRVVVLHFMEAKDAPWSLRAPLEAWIFLIGVGLLAIWYSLI